MSKAAVYRVQLDDVPELTEEELRIAISGNLVSDEDTIINHVGLFPSCYSAKEESVALVKFTNTPKFLSSLVKNPDDSRTISLSNGVSAEFDRKFNGFTPVNRPDEAEGIEADIIAISGIGGHAYGSWAYSQDGTTFMWIQDALPKMFPHCRIMLYGYESKLDSVSTNRISDYCAGLQEHLNLVRKSEEERTRPVIFISHSFGGIIAANTLIQAQLGFDRAFYNAMDAFFFFGTPHKGLSVQEILDMLVDPNHPRVDLLGQIDSKNKFLGDQLRNFKNVLGDRKVTSFYETKLTRKLVKVSGDDGRWSRSGPYLELSSQENSLLGLNDALEKKISVDEDHSNMVKFKSRRVAAYRSLVDALKDVLPEAQERVLGRTGTFRVDS
ncbi:hypothetical protein P280DRAFT_412043 [Massarina eburnea CBS 473.64]|uniref:DUF676 domain-containing protein n=1 Tax=Massarina eburnea CBS 473.64 TaxID=1395130 RepID=A0A6A6RJD7_9PLEO|nr:hypothetical protein P280DRAFT_412043 [Massarina eburnea CBS 473.64]